MNCQLIAMLRPCQRVASSRTSARSLRQKCRLQNVDRHIDYVSTRRGRKIPSGTVPKQLAQRTGQKLNLRRDTKSDTKLLNRVYHAGTPSCTTDAPYYMRETIAADAVSSRSQELPARLSFSSKPPLPQPPGGGRACCTVVCADGGLSIA